MTPKRRNQLTNALDVLGLACLVGAAAAIWWIAGLIVAGLGLLTISWRLTQ